LSIPTNGSGRLAPERLAQRGLDRRAFGVLAFMNAEERFGHPLKLASTASAIGTLRVERLLFGVPNSPKAKF
jgi:hypothetical protein